MKKLIVLIVAIVAIMPVNGQELFEKLVEQYSDREGFSAVQLTSDMFDLYLKKKNIDEEDPVYDVIDNLENILVITQSNLTSGSRTFLKDGNIILKGEEDVEVDEDSSLKDIHSEILDYYKEAGLFLFKTEKKIGNDLKIYIDRDEDGVSSLGLVNLTDFALTLIEINGTIDLSSIANLSSAFNIRGLETLRKIDDSGNYFLAPDLSNFDVPDIRGFGISKERQMELEESLKRAEEEMKLNRGRRIDEERSSRLKEKEFFEQYKREPIFLNRYDKNTEYYLNGKKVSKEELKGISSSDIVKTVVEKVEKDGEVTKSIVKITTKK